jgi:hypothetical protein
MEVEQPWENNQLIACCQEAVEHDLKFQLWEKKYSFIIEQYQERIDKSKSVSFSPDTIQWMIEDTVISEVDNYLSTKYSIPLKTNGKFTFTNAITREEESLPLELELIIDMWFHFDPIKPSYNYVILSLPKKLLKNYIEEIYKVATQNQIISLHHLPWRFDDKNSSVFFIDITRLPSNMGKLFNDFDVHDDIVRCHQDIVFGLGEVLTFKPFISVYTDMPVTFQGRTLYTFSPTIYDKLYLAACARVIELFYNYWAKLAIVLAKFFTSDLPEQRIFFHSVIDKIENRAISSPSKEWLIKFRHGVYIDLNARRKRIVHYQSLESETMDSYRKNYSDYDKLQRIQTKKENLTDYLLEHYHHSIEGFYHTMKLVESNNG